MTTNLQTILSTISEHFPNSYPCFLPFGTGGVEIPVSNMTTHVVFRQAEDGQWSWALEKPVSRNGATSFETFEEMMQDFRSSFVGIMERHVSTCQTDISRIRLMDSVESST